MRNPAKPEHEVVVVGWCLVACAAMFGVVIFGSVLRCFGT